ncbi:MAG: hypothetical protein AB1758_27495 [Candidatus Eremiobacterota bacterium]
MVLSIATGTVLAYGRAYRRAAEQRPASVRVAAGLEALCRDLRSATRLVHPASLAQGYAPRLGQTPPLVVEHPVHGQVGWTCDPASHRLLRIVGGQQRAVGEGDALRVRQEGRFLLVRVEDAPGRTPWETRLRLLPACLRAAGGLP